MRKIISTGATLVLLTSSILYPAAAKAENGQIGAGVVGGLIGGALLGSALASRPAPPPVVYYEPEPVYVEAPVCRFVGERFWDGFGWQVRRVRICN
jgi:hypothetical protein